MGAKYSVLGETDHTSTVRQLLRSAEEGASVTLRSVPSRPRVLLVKRMDPDGNAELELGIQGRDAAFAPLVELSRRLDELRIPFSLEVRERGARASGIRVCFCGPALEGGLAGRMVDLALWAAGLRPGEEYIHRFGSGDDLDEEAGAGLLGTS